MRPGINVTISSTPPTRSAPTDTGTWFVGGETEKGGTDKPILIRSMDDYATLLGARVSYGFLYDALDLFFRDGGNQAYVCRVVGPAALAASHVFNDAGAAASLKVSANGPGDWGNNLKVAIIAPVVAGFRIQVTDAANNVLETSPDLADKTDAFAWAQGSAYVTLTDQASQNNPAQVAAVALAGGTDDRANALDAHWKLAIDKADSSYGPGQVSYPGRTTDQAHLDLLSHAAANNRRAVLDAPDTNSEGTLDASVGACRAGNEIDGAMFGPWLESPGVTAGLQRTIPPSALAAARIAAVDALYDSNHAAAGDLGESSYAQDVSQVFTDDVRERLNDAGLNAIIVKNGVVTIYGWRSLANPASEDTWLDFGNSRLVMSLVAKINDVMDRYMFQPIDGQGRLFSRVTGSIKALLTPLFNSGSLFGSTPDGSYKVVCDQTNNTPDTIQNRQLIAAVQIRPSTFAEEIDIQIVKTPINEEVN